VPLPDTPPMALHRGRIDLLEDHLRRDPDLLTRTFAHADIYPASLRCHGDETLAVQGTPLAGSTLLHMAVDYDEIDITRWLLERGTPADAKADVDGEGFGGHTALFGCVVVAPATPWEPELAQLLLQHGANPNARASLRKDGREYRDVTPISWGQQFHDRDVVNESAMRLIAERGGR
jgi:ankyrin repeat protein